MSRNGKTNGRPAALRERRTELPRYRIEIATKFGMTDAPGAALIGQMPAIGVSGAREIRVSSLYEITGPLSRNQIEQLSRELLSDPITQEYRMDASTPSPAFLVGPHWRVEVWLKPTVTDPAGESVCKAVRDLGFPPPHRVRTGTAYRILGRLGRGQTERICARLLANPMIHQTSLTQL